MAELKRVEEMTDSEAVQELIEHSILLDGDFFEIYDKTTALEREIDLHHIRQNIRAQRSYYHETISPKSIVFLLAGYGLMYCTPYSSRIIDMLLKLSFAFDENIGGPVLDENHVPCDDELRTYWERLVNSSNGEYMEEVYRLQAEASGRTKYLSDEEISCCFQVKGTVITDSGAKYSDRFDSLKSDELGTYCQMGGIMVIRNTNGRLYITTDMDVMVAVSECFEYRPQPVPFYCGGKPADENLASEFARIIQRH